MLEGSSDVESMRMVLLACCSADSLSGLHKENTLSDPPNLVAGRPLIDYIKMHKQLLSIKVIEYIEFPTYRIYNEPILGIIGQQGY